MTAAADLRQRVAFESQAAGDDTFGGTQGAWVEQFVRRARVWYRLGSEPVIAQRLAGVQPVEITVRADEQTETVTAAWRVRDANSGALFNIRSVAPDETGFFIKMTCEAGVAT